MARFIKKHQNEIGASPDDFIFIGEKKTENTVLRIIDYDKNNLEEIPINSVEEALAYQDKKSTTWFNVDGIDETHIMKQIAEGFQFDDFIIAEVMNTNSRPKVQEYDNCLFTSIKMLQVNENSHEISFENLSLIITKSVLISFQEKKGDVFEPVRIRIRKQKKRIINSGSDYLLFALLDVVIDNYIYILSVLGDKIENLEEQLIQSPEKSIIDAINKHKKELNYLRKNILPAREMLVNLTKIDSEFINHKNFIHFKELQNNINHAVEISDSYREILSDQLNIYHTTVSTKLNDIMKFLTVFSVVFIPLTFIAGIYGTNFDVIPELRYKYSYFIMLGSMVVIAIGMLYYFKRKKWF
ncbi:Cobalt/magnesium transport protein CorA [Polaribacter huanghezhanensis]|uniref:magnesium/cobalt transporter CorA n=1 Tax=Polaribacter huanghezhanensis TaxID=1354726 RepID=UPI00264A2E96|nr:magnesium/cobalt transporter CorA [Polaribacter huanghezhanensis]WKD85822.1 Cobalt/magnesium transport protein CorA [Polaribacter huanghezhanensis]